MIGIKGIYKENICRVKDRKSVLKDVNFLWKKENMLSNPWVLPVSENYIDEYYRIRINRQRTFLFWIVRILKHVRRTQCQISAQ